MSSSELVSAPPVHESGSSPLFAVKLPSGPLGEQTKRSVFFPPEGIKGLPVWPKPVIFIGHGHLKDWLEVEKYLKEELHLECEGFDAKPPAGYTTQARIETSSIGPYLPSSS